MLSLDSLKAGWKTPRAHKGATFWYDDDDDDDDERCTTNPYKLNC